MPVEVRGTEQLIARFTQAPDKVRKELAIEMQAIAYELQAYIQTSKLSGQVLNVRTGALRAHIFSRVDSYSTNITATVYISIGQVPYAGIHEYGGLISHPGGTAYIVTSAGARFVPNSSALAGSLPRTRPHPIALAERSYMRSGLADRSSIILTQLKSAVARGLKK